MASEQNKNRLIGVAKITTAHGVRGQVRLVSEAEDLPALTESGPLFSKDEQTTYVVRLSGRHKDGWLASIEGIVDRDAALTLRGKELYVPRNRLPEIEDEQAFHYADLVGLRAEDPEKAGTGTIIAVHDFGHVHQLEIRPKNGEDSYFLPFTQEAVPEIHVEEGYVVIHPPLILIQSGDATAPE